MVIRLTEAVAGVLAGVLNTALPGTDRGGRTDTPGAGVDRTGADKRRHSRPRVRPDGIPGWAYVAAGGCLTVALAYVVFVPLVHDRNSDALSAGLGSDDSCDVPLVCANSAPVGPPPPLASSAPSDGSFLPTPEPTASTRPTPRARTPQPSPSGVVEPPAGAPRLTQVFVSNLPFEAASNGFGPVERDQSNGERDSGDGRTLTIGGVQYAKGLGVHAPSDVKLRLDGRCSTFHAFIGLDDEKDSVDQDGQVSFLVIADGDKTVFESPMLNFSDQPYEVNANISGAQVIDLVVDQAGSRRSDHADWADAQVGCTAS